MAVSETAKKIAANMRRIIDQSGISQEKVANLIGLNSQPALSNYLLGKSEVSLETLENFCKFYDIPISMMFEDEADSLTKLCPDENLRKAIIQELDIWLRHEKVWLMPKDRHAIIMNLCKRNLGAPADIKTFLFLLQSTNSTIFQKNK
jgi:transcriptional regulator with XRE-family HTH domain